MYKKAVVLLSGGLDSATTLAIAQDEGFSCYALSFDYGQRHAVELNAARAVAARSNVAEHRCISLDPRAFSGSALTSSIPVPKNRPVSADSTGIPETYVPARNTVFLSYALGWAEIIGSTDLFIGVNAVDYSGYPDCRPEFIAAFETLANLATKSAVEGNRITVHAPLLSLTKEEIIAQGHSLGVVYALTHSCYDPAPDGRACGACDSCRIRREGFHRAGVPDPTRYRKD